jgi:ATP-binding cassette subfamily B protein
MRRPLGSAFAKLLYFMRPFRSIYIPAVFYSLLNKFFSLVPEVLLVMAMNTVVAKEDSWLANCGFYDLKIQLFVLGILMMVSYAFESLFEYLYSIRWWKLAQLVQHNFRVQAFDRVQKSTVRSSLEQKTGNLLAILNDDINQLERFLEEGINSIIAVIGTTLFIGGIFFYLAPQIAVLVICPIPIIVLATFIFREKISSYYFNVRKKAGEIGIFLANSLLRLLTTKSFVAEDIEKKKLELVSMEYKEANFHAIKWGALFEPVIRFFVLCGLLVTLVYAGMLTIDGEVDVWVYSTLMILTPLLLTPFTDVAYMMVDFQRVMASTDRLLDLFDLPVEHFVDEVVSIKGSIAFVNVSFSYKKKSATLRNISFHINPGEHVAFVGATGVGKSTLLHLLLGFYFPDAGSIIFDGQDIHKISLSGLRRKIGIVSQDTVLFEGTILENISYGYPEATREQIIKAAKNAAAHDFIMKLPNGYDTVLEERGQYLSGGQRQMLAIARAIVREPAILILDEATSAVDYATEAMLIKTLSEVGKGRTVVNITHKLSTAKLADRICVLDKGTIVEEGTHQALLTRGEVYARFWELYKANHFP